MEQYLPTMCLEECIRLYRAYVCVYLLRVETRAGSRVRYAIRERRPRRDRAATRRGAAPAACPGIFTVERVSCAGCHIIREVYLLRVLKLHVRGVFERRGGEEGGEARAVAAACAHTASRRAAPCVEAFNVRLYTCLTREPFKSCCGSS